MYVALIVLHHTARSSVATGLEEEGICAPSVSPPLLMSPSRVFPSTFRSLQSLVTPIVIHVTSDYLSVVLPLGSTLDFQAHNEQSDGRWLRSGRLLCDSPEGFPLGMQASGCFCSLGALFFRIVLGPYAPLREEKLAYMFLRVDPVRAEKFPGRPLAGSFLPPQRTAAPHVTERVWGPGLCCGRDELEGLG